MSRSLIKTFQTCSQKNSINILVPSWLLRNNVTCRGSKYRVANNTHVAFSSTRKCKIGHSTILLQDGSDFQELPVIVKKINDDELLSICKATNGNEPGTGPLSSPKNEQLIDNFETEEIANGFKQCFSTKGVLKLLDLIPANEVTSSVALEALKSIVTLQSNQQFRNKMSANFPEDVSDNFTKTAVFNNLIEVIAMSDDSKIILEGLKTIAKDSPTNNVNSYTSKLCEETLIRVNDGKFDIVQVCDAVKAFYDLGNKDINKLWIGLMERQADINEDNVMNIVRILPLMKQSRRLILNILERKASNFWCSLTSREVSEFLITMRTINSYPPSIVNHLSRWINTNLHNVQEEDLVNIVKGFMSLEHSEQGVEKAIERFIKAKGLKIKNPEVFTSIMEYCKKFKIRSSIIFDGCVEFYTHNPNKVFPEFLKSLIYPLGFLNFHPSQGQHFWEIFENDLKERFVELSPEDALDIMLACVFLEKHPLNFVKNIFNPIFLDRLHFRSDQISIHTLRSKLKLFDTALTLECDLYKGPMLPRDHSAKSVWQDGRVRRMSTFLVDTLKNIFENKVVVSTSVILNNFPYLGVYIVDILMHPSNISSVINYKQNRNMYTALLIHIPEHYDSKGEYLIGPQVMRRRHLQLIGMKVVDLNYTTLAKLKVHPKDLKTYLNDQIQKTDMVQSKKIKKY